MRLSQRNDTPTAVLLLGTFIVHNLEETYHFPTGYEKLPVWVQERGLWCDQKCFLVATGLLTTTVAAALWAGLRSHGYSRAVLLGAPSAALMGNALTHGARALIQRSYNGGLATAPLMGLLASSLFTSSTRTLRPSVRSKIFGASNVAAICAIVGSLRGGRYALSFSQRTRYPQGTLPLYQRSCTR